MDGRMVLFIFLLLFLNFGVCLVRGGVFIFDLGILDFSIVVPCLRSDVLSTHPGKPRGIPKFSPLATTHVICCVLGVTAFVRQRVAGDLGQSDGRRLGSYNEQTAGTTGARCQVRFYFFYYFFFCRSLVFLVLEVYRCGRFVCFVVLRV
nr:hypothetical protein Itr_chr02CG09600 [Ipomoea trifida]